jgi:hypothetical protein
LSIFHCQLIRKALTSEPCEIDFHCDKGKLALDLRRRSGHEVQNHKDELKSEIDECTQRVSDFWVGFETALEALQQSVGRPVPGHD